MEFAEKLASLASKVKQQKAGIETEEATKNAFVMPFISLILGYDVFNPQEVVPEFTADVGIKKGEKIDYAIVHEGVVQILVEAKKIGDPLKIEHASQLFRYFAVTNARIAVLTNGEVFHFFTDLDAPNRMDEKPFLVLDLSDIDETLIPELQKLTKDVFDLDSIINAAGELKYIGEIKRAMASQFKNPGDDWVKFFTSRVYEGAYTQKVREQFTTLVTKASKQFLADQVNERLKVALGGGPAILADDTAPAGAAETEQIAEASVEDIDDDGVITTVEELEGFHIIRAIVCGEVKPNRVAARDTKSYFGVLLDDNNRKPIARLHFNRSKRYIGLFDAYKNETRVEISALEDIYEHADHLRGTIQNYL